MQLNGKNPALHVSSLELYQCLVVAEKAAKANGVSAIPPNKQFYEKHHPSLPDRLGPDGGERPVAEGNAAEKRADENDKDYEA